MAAACDRSVWPSAFLYALDRLEVAWRISRRNTVSVARTDAVQRLDQFVGPKY
jgi:hypothetical protein